MQKSLGSRPTPAAWTPAPSGELRLAPTDPSHSAIEIRFSLASAATAHIAIFDVAGRQVHARDLDGFGPGEHLLQLDVGSLRPGLYLIRLRQTERQVLARCLLIR